MRREVGRGTPHLIYPVHVVEDAGDRLTVFLASGTPLSSPEGSWPWSEEGHPWAARGRWEGHGVLQMLSAVEPFSTWVFWEGEERSLDCWYINLQELFRRTPDGIDSQDLELDFVVAPDGSWHKKDDDLLDVWMDKGRWTADEVARIREIGARVDTRLRARKPWWMSAGHRGNLRSTGSLGFRRSLERANLQHRGTRRTRAPNPGTPGRPRPRSPRRTAPRPHAAGFERPDAIGSYSWRTA
jgi:hypothetical protein